MGTQKPEFLSTRGIVAPRTGGMLVLAGMFLSGCQAASCPSSAGTTSLTSSGAKDQESRHPPPLRRPSLFCEAADPRLTSGEAILTAVQNPSATWASLRTGLVSMNQALRADPSALQLIEGLLKDSRLDCESRFFLMATLAASVSPGDSQTFLLDLLRKPRLCASGFGDYCTFHAALACLCYCPAAPLEGQRFMTYLESLHEMACDGIHEDCVILGECGYQYPCRYAGQMLTHRPSNGELEIERRRQSWIVFVEEGSQGVARNSRSVEASLALHALGLDGSISDAATLSALHNISTSTPLEVGCEDARSRWLNFCVRTTWQRARRE